MNLFGAVELITARTARQRAAELDRLRRAAGTPVSPTPAMAADLIALADQLDELVEETPLADRDPAAGRLRAARRRVGTLLALCGIATIRDEGELDFLRHEIVADRPAPEPGLVDHIAATLRPGYRSQDTLLRPQQVIAYRS